MAGARRNGINWLVDGAANVDVGSNITLLSTPTLESIEEFKIITSSYAAEWPRSGGGIVNVVTKSGSNQFRGERLRVLPRRRAEREQLLPQAGGLPAGGECSNDPAQVAIRENPAPLKYHNFGYTLRRPDQEGQRCSSSSPRSSGASTGRPPRPARPSSNPAWLTDPDNANYVAPALRDPNAVRLLEACARRPTWARIASSTRAPTDQDTRQEVVRVDWHASSKWRFMGRYTHDLSRDDASRAASSSTPLVPDVATTLTDVPGQIFVGQVITTISPRMLNELSYQFSSNAITSVYGDNARNQRDRVRADDPRAVPREPRRPDPDRSTSRGLALDRRQPALRQRLQEPHHRRQPDLAAREPLLQGRLPRRASREERAVHERHPGPRSTSPPAGAAPPSRTS